MEILPVNQLLASKVSEFPANPGVYLMKDAKGKIIYVGKAKNLKSRVKQYLPVEGDGRYQIKFLMERVQDIDYLVTDTEQEALLLENSLIKKHKPKYNVFLKDDKTYISLKLTLTHPFPRLVATRNVKKDGSLYFGPYVNAQACYETADFAYKYFMLRTCSDHEFSNRSRPCLEYQIKRCTAPCVGYVTESQYGKQVNEIKLLLLGKNEELKKELKNKMLLLSEQEKFEDAAPLRDALNHLEQLLEKQKVVKHTGENQDYVTLYRENEQGMIAVLSVRNGDLVDSHYYPVVSVEMDTEVLGSFMNQYYLTTPFIPSEILVSTTIPDVEALLEFLREKKGKKVCVRNPQKGDKKDLMELAQKNAIAQFARKVHKKFENTEALSRLEKALDLKNPLKRIECYDISNISGKNPTGSRVTFIEGEPDKNLYRQYKIRSMDTPNDYAMMMEMLMRRFDKEDINNEGDACPDLLIVDGGKGQLGVALEVLKDLNIESVPVIGVAKGQGQGVRAKGLWDNKKEEEIYLPGRKNPVILKRGSPELMLLQRIRDESHRFALKYHRKLRDTLKKKR
ncbi:excinuclease ABC subunit UvrC [bacterium]|nr:excinuclease ABC subunit UvrC [bacterium]